MITDKELDLIVRKIKNKYGLDLSYYKNSFVKRRLNSEINRSGLSTSEYINTFDAKKYKRLLKSLSINVSEFFRDPPVFEILDELIIPNLIHYKKEINASTIRVWSAGCASGEEAYSIAILLKEALGDDISKYQVRVLGTDMDSKALGQAKMGIYPKDRVKNVRADLLEKYFFTDGQWYEVDDEIKKMMRFSKHDLIHDEIKSYFDIILCRNVLIYMSRDLQEILFKHFHYSLQKFGFLVLGKTESLIGSYRKHFAIVDGPQRVYRKLS